MEGQEVQLWEPCPFLRIFGENKSMNVAADASNMFQCHEVLPETSSKC